MRRRRAVDADHPAYDPSACGPEGSPQCRRCLNELPPDQVMFCSDRCEHEFRMRSSATYARKAIFARDRGICTHCRLDCGLLDRIIAKLRHPPAHTAVDDEPRTPVISAEGEATAVWLIGQLGLGRRRRS